LEVDEIVLNFLDGYYGMTEIPATYKPTYTPPDETITKIVTFDSLSEQAEIRDKYIQLNRELMNRIVNLIEVMEFGETDVENVLMGEVGVEVARNEDMNINIEQQQRNTYRNKPRSQNQNQNQNQNQSQSQSQSKSPVNYKVQMNQGNTQPFSSTQLAQYINSQPFNPQFHQSQVVSGGGQRKPESVGKHKKRRTYKNRKMNKRTRKYRYYA